ncbi:MAG: glutathione S-transferase family protein [Pseudooceanicola atlanticus]
MSDLILTTYEWVPEVPRGYVRDLRVRWALEEAGLPYRVETTPFKDRGPDHLAHHPFAQVPYIKDGDQVVFESGAILLHLGEKSEVLVPRDPAGRSAVTQWVFAALNSVEMAGLPWVLYRFSDDQQETPGRAIIERFLAGRLAHMNQLLDGREWLTGTFSVADILMADVFRLIDRFDALEGHDACRAYMARAIARPAFEKAYADQMALFADETAPV